MTVAPGPASPLNGLQDWYRSPLGAAVVRIECASVQRLLANTFGYYLVQIGVSDGFDEALSASRIRHRIRLPTQSLPTSVGGSIVGLPAQLPIASDSIDAVLLPHTLDFVDDPKGVLSEVERILIPEGRIVVVGFNALSAWGLRRLLARRSKGRLPWCGRYHLASGVEDWLADLGFDIEVRELLMFCPPVGTTRGRRCAALENLGRRFWPFFGNIYVIRAVKRVATLTPVRPLRSKPSPLLTGRAVRPTTRGTWHA